MEECLLASFDLIITPCCLTVTVTRLFCLRLYELGTPWRGEHAISLCAGVAPGEPRPDVFLGQKPRLSLAFRGHGVAICLKTLKILKQHGRRGAR